MPSDLPAVPTSRDDLLIAALRHADVTSGTLNRIREEVYRVLGRRCDDRKYDRLHDLLRRSLYEESAVFLFIGATRVGVDLPDDLQDKPACGMDNPELLPRGTHTGWPSIDDKVAAALNGQPRLQLPVAADVRPGSRSFGVKVTRPRKGTQEAHDAR